MNRALVRAKHKLGRLIKEAAASIDPSSPQAFGMAINAVKDNIVKSFEDYMDRQHARGAYEGDDFSRKISLSKNDPMNNWFYIIKRATNGIAAAFCNEDSGMVANFNRTRGGVTYSQNRAEAEDIRPEFAQIVSKWRTLQSVCNKAAVKAYWELYKKYKDYVSEDFTAPNGNISDNRRRYLMYKQEVDELDQKLNDTPKGEKSNSGRSLRAVYYERLKKAKEMMRYYGDRGGENDPTAAWDRWKNKDGGINTAMMRLDYFFKNKSTKGQWLGAYQRAFEPRIDEEHLGWAIQEAIKDGIAKIHVKAWEAKKAEDDEWYEMMAKDVTPPGSSGNAMVDAHERAEREGNSRWGRRY